MRISDWSSDVCSSDLGTKAAYFASLGWSAQGIAVPNANSVWTASGAKLTPTTPVTLSWANTTGQNFRIEYSIDSNYLITAKQTIANTGSAPVSASSFALIDRLGKPTDPHEQDSWRSEEHTSELQSL